MLDNLDRMYLYATIRAIDRAAAGRCQSSWAGECASTDVQRGMAGAFVEMMGIRLLEYEPPPVRSS